MDQAFFSVKLGKIALCVEFPENQGAWNAPRLLAREGIVRLPYRQAGFRAAVGVGRAARENPPLLAFAGGAVGWQVCTLIWIPVRGQT